MVARHLPFELPRLALVLALAGCVSPAPAGLPERAAPFAAVRAPAAATPTDAGAAAGERADLARLAGAYEVRLEDLSGAAPRVAGRGTGRLELCLGGRFLALTSQVELAADAERGAGRVGLARGMLGRDGASGEWQLFWASELGGTMSLARGRGDLAAAGLVLREAPGAPATVLRATAEGLVFEHRARAADGQERLVARTRWVRSGAADEPAGDAGGDLGTEDQ